MIYVFDIKKDDIKILCRMIKKIHLIDDFKTHMFIKNDIVEPKQIMLNVNKSKVFIDNYDVIINIFYRQRDNYIRRAIYARETLIMLFRSKCFIFITKIDDVLFVKDFLFEFVIHVNITLHAHLIDIKIYEIFVKNDIDYTIKIFKKI